MIPQNQWYSSSSAKVSRAGSLQLRKDKVRSEMGKGVGELDGPFEGWTRTCKGWRRHIWDIREGKMKNGAVSHRPEQANGVFLSLNQCPTGKVCQLICWASGKEGTCHCACGWELQLLLAPLCYWMCCALPLPSCNLLKHCTEPYHHEEKTLAAELKDFFQTWIFHMKELLVFQTICIFLTCYWSDWTVLSSKAHW